MRSIVFKVWVSKKWENPIENADNLEEDCALKKAQIPLVHC